MTREIPKQLQNPEYRFYLASKDRKHPFEKKWTTDNNYMFFEPKVLEHLRRNGNVGICTGHGNLIVIDFDDEAYQSLKSKELPQTFTTRTAGKGLKHFYYTLNGEMVSKIGLDKYVLNRKEIGSRAYWELKLKTSIPKMRSMLQTGALEISRILDIQAGGGAITCPPSRIGNRIYSVIDDHEIVEIDAVKLTEVFGLTEFRKPKARNHVNVIQSGKIQKSVDMMLEFEVKRTNTRHYKCPFHKMHGQGNMWIGDDGSIHCFNCRFHVNSAQEFKDYMEKDKVII